MSRALSVSLARRSDSRMMSSNCGLCHLNENPDQKIILRNHAAIFLQNEKEQGALLGSGVIIPVRHAETVFDLTYARHAPVSAGTLCGTRHPILAEATGKSVVVSTSSAQMKLDREELLHEVSTACPCLRPGGIGR